MAKTFVRISLATKFRVLFASAVLAILVVALGVPWYFAERLVDASAERSADQVTALALAEWVRRHQSQPPRPSALAADFAALGGGRRGPTFVPLTSPQALRRMENEKHARRAVSTFRKEPWRELAAMRAEDTSGRSVYRCFRAVRARARCRDCHDGVAARAFQPNQLVGVLDVAMPPPPGALVWWTRGVFLLGGFLAALLGAVIFYLITKQIVLTPVRKLHALADQVAEGDLTKRVTIHTGDEFERLGRRFNEMLDAITIQQERLRQANRALDVRLGELAEANVALYEANRIKNEFLANVSHELRTPLNSIIGFAELLADTDDERRRRHATHILTSARMLLGIINDLLDLARIEAGKMELHADKVAITDLCETLAQLVRPLADKNDLELRVEIAGDIPVVVTDGGKVRQVLYNLLSNAIKFTPPGGRVTLSAHRLSAAQSPLHADSVAVAVADTGPGIPAAEQEQIFEKFHRLDGRLTREHGGAGLGLAISRELSALLGGRLTLNSEPGHGATFTLILPIQPPQDDSRDAKPSR